jgi:hypothetical protein
MWWGTAVEAPDPGALARFDAELLGWPIGHGEPGTTVLAAPEGSVYVVFQQAAGYRAPTWPPAPGEQRPMMHAPPPVARWGNPPDQGAGSPSAVRPHAEPGGR